MPACFFHTHWLAGHPLLLPWLHKVTFVPLGSCQSTHWDVPSQESSQCLKVAQEASSRVPPLHHFSLGGASLPPPPCLLPAFPLPCPDLARTSFPSPFPGWLFSPGTASNTLPGLQVYVLSPVSRAWSPCAQRCLPDYRLAQCCCGNDIPSPQPEGIIVVRAKSLRTAFSNGRGNLPAFTCQHVVAQPFFPWPAQRLGWGWRQRLAAVSRSGVGVGGLADGLPVWPLLRGL